LHSLRSRRGTSGTISYNKELLFAPERKAEFAERINYHLTLNIYATKHGETKKKNSVDCCTALFLRCFYPGYNQKKPLPLGGDDEVDDLVSPLAIEAYVRHRASRACVGFRTKAPQLGGWGMGLEIVGFCVTSFGAVLAVIELGEWVALVVAIGAILQNVSE
jgi:hypothetical protein